MAYKLLIFDLDGTLLDSKMDIANSTNYVRNQLGKESLSPDLIQQYVGAGVNELLEQAFSTQDPEIISKAAKMFRTHYLEHCMDESMWYPGVVEALEKLKTTHILTVCTNKPKPYADKVLKVLNGGNYFKAVVAGRDGFENKPDPAGTLSLLKRFNVKPQDTLFVGDSMVDLETAQKAGIDMAFLSWGFGHDSNKQARYALNDFAGLLKICL
ncbi:HAD family hydrolase [bacterium]|nr:HAD family hydrolase [bacterium]